MDVSTAAAVAIVIAVVRRKRRQLKRKKRSVWTKDWVLRRRLLGAEHCIVSELRLEDPSSYRNYLRMDRDELDNLLGMIIDDITKKDTNMRAAIPPKERLTATLRFLATGESYTSLQYQLRIHKSTLAQIIPEVCDVICKKLKDDFLKVPTEEHEWMTVSEGFEKQWNFPHCIGALDGKHIRLQQPANSGSYFYNYKNMFSIVLLALVDSNYKFLFVDVGCNGRVSDGGVFRSSPLSRALEENDLNIPPAQSLRRPTSDLQECGEGSAMSDPLPYVIVADDAFPLKRNIMKPFAQRGLNPSQRVFNYRLSRARRVVENAFGILSNRFRVFMKPLAIAPEGAEKVVLAACALHNYLRKQSASSKQNTSDDTFEACAMTPMCQQSGNFYATEAKQVRDRFRVYFNSPEGAVSWQPHGEQP